MNNIAFAGAGFSSAVMAYKLAEAGFNVTVFESRDHVAGNCYTQRDAETGILIHTYGPHIFHTDDQEVWNFVNTLGEFKPFINRVKTTSNNAVYSLPINLHTINQFFNKSFSPSEAKAFICTLTNVQIEHPKNFEEQAISLVGTALYEAFLKGYTIKQWGVDPQELPASILKRLPLRFNYDDNYFNHPYQGIPVNGYTPIVEKLLNHKNITVKLNSPFNADLNAQFDHTFFSGPLDSYFNYSLGRLSYRTLDFKAEVHQGDYQGIAVMNYADEDIPYTRITEHKHFSPWETHNQTFIYKEYSRACEEGDTPYYPLNLACDKKLLNLYIDLAKSSKNISFIGRLGSYQYLDMDVCIRRALDAADTVLKLQENNKALPRFFNSHE